MPLLKMIDFNSRNPPKCFQENCRECEELLSGDITYFGKVQVEANMLEVPDVKLMSLAGWKNLQQSCPDMRRAHAFIIRGKGVQKKEKGASEVRTYLKECTVNKEGLIVKRK